MLADESWKTAAERSAITGSLAAEGEGTTTSFTQVFCTTLIDIISENPSLLTSITSDQADKRTAPLLTFAQEQAFSAPETTNSEIATTVSLNLS